VLIAGLFLCCFATEYASLKTDYCSSGLELGDPHGEPCKLARVRCRRRKAYQRQIDGGPCLLVTQHRLRRQIRRQTLGDAVGCRTARNMARIVHIFERGEKASDSKSNLWEREVAIQNPTDGRAAVIAETCGRKMELARSCGRASR